MNSSLLLVAALLLTADDTSATVVIENAVLKTAGEVDVPAAEAGVLTEMLAREGKFVQEGDSLGRIQDADVRLTLERTKLEAEIARRKMENDLAVQAAKKSVEVARAEYARSVETNKNYPKTVSLSELDRQRLMVERGELEAQQAEHDQGEARLKREVAERECSLAEEQLRRRHIVAPVGGMVIDVPHERGEWVQPGETIARIMRIDLLRAEGFLPVAQASLDLIGRKVTLTVNDPALGDETFPGEIVFVSPEIDPLNSQVRVWAEVKNVGRKLRPGQQATLKVHAP